jgi:hypothetical protein
LDNRAPLGARPFCASDLFLAKSGSSGFSSIGTQGRAALGRHRVRRRVDSLAEAYHRSLGDLAHKAPLQLTEYESGSEPIRLFEYNAFIVITSKTREPLNKSYAVLLLVDSHVGGFEFAP